MKSLISFMIFAVLLSSFLSIFGFFVGPIFSKTMSSISTTLNIIDNVFVSPVKGLVKGVTVIFSDNFYSDIVVIDPSNISDQEIIGLYPECFSGVKYLIEFKYSPLKNTAYGVTNWYAFHVKEKYEKIYICFDKDGEFLHFIISTVSENRSDCFRKFSGYATGSFFASHSNAAKITFKNYASDLTSFDPILIENKNFTIYVDSTISLIEIYSQLFRGG